MESDKCNNCGSASDTPMKGEVELNALMRGQRRHQAGIIKAEVTICRECGLMTFHAHLDPLATWIDRLK